MFHTYISLTVPSRVSNVTLIKAVRYRTPALVVNWSIPQSDVTLAQYQVQYRRFGTISWSTAANVSVSSPTTFAILSGLDAGTVYGVRVRAVSGVGAGMWSENYKMRTHYCEQ